MECTKALQDAASCTTNEGVHDFLSYLTQQTLSRVSGSDQAQTRMNLVQKILKVRSSQERGIDTMYVEVEAAADALPRFEVLSGQGYGIGFGGQELRLTASELGRITGAIDVEDLLHVLFADFCIGK